MRTHAHAHMLHMCACTSSCSCTPVHAVFPTGDRWGQCSSQRVVLNAAADESSTRLLGAFAWPPARAEKQDAQVEAAVFSLRLTAQQSSGAVAALARSTDASLTAREGRPWPQPVAMAFATVSRELDAPARRKTEAACGCHGVARACIFDVAGRHSAPAGAVCAAWPRTECASTASSRGLPALDFLSTATRTCRWRSAAVSA